MRIGMILDKTFPPDPRVENEAISLIKNGHEVFLFCLKYGIEKDFEIINGIQVCRFQSNKLNYKLSALVYTIPVYSFIMSKKIKKFLLTNKIEALHIHDIQIAEAAIMANQKLKLPIVLDLHDNMPEIIKHYPHLQKFPGKQLISPNKWKEKEEEFIRISDKIITVSNEFIEEVIERTQVPKEKVVLVPNSVLPSFYMEVEFNKEILNRYKNDFVLLYLGDTALRRGLRTAIRALEILKSKIPNVKLVVVGKNTTDIILKKLVNDLQLDDFVDFQGWRDVSLFPSYIECSSICISPLNRNIQHDVAYANKLFQYMSMAKPLLVSNAIAQKKLVEKTKAGLVHLEKDPLDFAEKVFQMYGDEYLRETCGNNGKMFIQNEFNWDLTSKKLVELYENLIS